MNWGSKLPIYNQTTLGPEILACGRLSFQLPRLGSHEAPDPELSAPCRCRTNMTELELVDGAQAQQDRVTSLAVILVHMCGLHNQEDGADAKSTRPI